MGGAWQLALQDKADVVVLEQRDDVGGNAGSFEVDDIRVDYGSHRLHPACDTRILDDLRALLGDDLLARPRHGRIRLRGHWIHFPLKPFDLARHLPWSFTAGVARDALSKAVATKNGDSDPTFASVLRRGLGATICRDFYFPYARKIWGLAPEEISPIQAYRRVSAGSLTKMFRKIIRKTSTTPRGGTHFYYPRNGYGQISRAIADAAIRSGADIRLGTKVHRIELGEPHQIFTEHDGSQKIIHADHVWSTIPVAALAKFITPPPPTDVLDASTRVESRSMILIYLLLDENQFTPYDAHYFPGSDVVLTRLSEPKNYSGRRDPEGRTVLCAELPCAAGDEYWQMSDDALADLVRDALARCRLEIRSTILRTTTKRLTHAYPIYRRGYDTHLGLLDDWVGGLDRFLTYGRQGLFVHDNTHHALAMAYAAAECLDRSGHFDRNRWIGYRAEFDQHVVED